MLGVHEQRVLVEQVVLKRHAGLGLALDLVPPCRPTQMLRATTLPLGASGLVVEDGEQLRVARCSRARSLVGHRPSGAAPWSAPSPTAQPRPRASTWIAGLAVHEDVVLDDVVAPAADERRPRHLVEDVAVDRVPQNMSSRYTPTQPRPSKPLMWWK